MKRRAALQAFAALGAVAMWPARARTPLVPEPLAASSGTLLCYRAFPSRHALPRDVRVWLPPGYRADGPAHGVLYMHDGQNLFEPGQAFGGEEWGVDETLAPLIASGAVSSTIVVGLSNTALRSAEYLPGKVFERLPEGLRQQVIASRMASDAMRPLSDGYLKSLVLEVKPFIDQHYRTRRGPAHTAVMGSSMGGLISLYALGEYPQAFGAAGCLSTHWPLLMPRTLDPRPPAEVAATIGAFRGWLESRLHRLRGHTIYMDCGDATLDALYPPFQAAFADWMGRAATDAGARFVSRTFPGAAHNEAAWRARLAEPLTAVLPPAASSTSRPVG
jgi:Putative esterase